MVVGSAGSSPKRDLFLCLVALAVACLLVYERALQSFLLADDFTVIRSFWGKGPRYLLGLLVSDEIGGQWPERFLRPVRPWTLALDGWIWGFEPFGFHLTNLLLHAAASSLVAVIVLRLGGTFLSAFLAALLFLLHPLNVEVATWVSGRDESLACATLLGAVACYLEAAKGGSRLWLALCCALLAASLLAKEYALLLRVGVWLSSLMAPSAGDSRLRALRRSVSSSIPLLGVIVVFLGLRFYALGNPLGGYGSGAEAHTTLRLDVLLDSLAAFARDLVSPLSAQPYLAAGLALGCFVPLLDQERTDRDPARAHPLLGDVVADTLPVTDAQSRVHTSSSLHLVRGNGVGPWACASASP